MHFLAHPIFTNKTKFKSEKPQKTMSSSGARTTKSPSKEYEQRRRKKLHEKGLCSSCRKRKAYIKHTCYRCLLQKLAGRHLADRNRWGELHALYVGQGYACFYTGVPIKVGADATIDHILPASRFPSRVADIGNLCWVSQEVNRMKSDMTMDEFIKRCRDILVNFGYEVNK